MGQFTASFTGRPPTWTLTVAVAATIAAAAAGCSATHTTPAASTVQPASNCAAIDAASASQAAPAPSSATPIQTTAPAVITGFDHYTQVRGCDYPGPSHYGWSSLRFKTADGVHCELYDGPNSFQYYSSIDCWGPLPGVPAGLNHVTLEPGSVPKYGQVDLQNEETETLAGFKTAQIDPRRYRELAPGQKIIVPGSRGGSGIDMNDEICAVDHDKTLICEIQHPQYEDHETHGFRLSPQGSTLY